MRTRRCSTAAPARGVLLLALAVLLAADPAGSRPALAATDPLLAQQWHLARIGAPDAWRATRGAGTTIAVVDSGADLAHEDLAGRIAGQTGCVGTLGDPGRCGGSGSDTQGHGTHVAGIAAADLGNGRGGAGVAPEARLLVVRTLSQVCRQVPGVGEQCVAQGSSDDTAAGIRWAADRGADVINLSLGESVSVRAAQGTQLGDDVEYAWSKGAIVVVAAGNDFDVLMGSRYGDLPMIVVTATGPNDARAPYANSVGSGVRWGLAAPGGSGQGACPSANILSTLWQPTGAHNTYGCMSGTSMAAPVVSGAAALLRSLGLSPRDAVDRLLSTAGDIGAAGTDAVFGSGLVDVRRAVGARSGGGGGGGASPAPPSQDAPGGGGGAAAGTGRAAPRAGGVPSTSTGGAAPDETPVAPGGAVPNATPDGDGEAVAGPALGARDREDGLRWPAVAAAALIALDLAALALRRRAGAHQEPRPKESVL